MSERLRASVWFVVFHPPTQQASQPATAKELLLHQARPARQGTLGWGVFRSVHTTHLPGRKNTQTAGKAPYPKWRRMVVHVRVVHLRTRPVNSIVLRDCYVRSSLVDRPDGFVPSWAELLWLQLAAFLFVCYIPAGFKVMWECQFFRLGRFFATRRDWGRVFDYVATSWFKRCGAHTFFVRLWWKMKEKSLLCCTVS